MDSGTVLLNNNQSMFGFVASSLIPDYSLGTGKKNLKLIDYSMFKTNLLGLHESFGGQSNYHL
jgi:hypothetical protein